VDAALKAYFKLATLGLACLRRGGLLVSASCSAHVQAEDFFDAVIQVKHLRLLQRHRLPC
jgi:23S rRNA (cytosine1962-C5)-methyltransferase